MWPPLSTNRREVPGSRWAAYRAEPQQKGAAMTLHTRVMVTSPGVDPAAAFVRMRQIIGAGEQYDAWTSPEPDSDNEYRRTMAPGFHMDLGQGLPALMWVKHNNGALCCDGGHSEWCDDDCSGEYDDPAGYIEINYDTVYGYRAANNASCGDLHAFITREITAWLDTQGVTWQWYDESGDGWQPDLSTYGTLGDPEVGRIGSTIQRTDRDPKREFGNLVAALVENGAIR